MSPYRRNVMVGITVLGALGVLAWMIVQFGGKLATPFADKTIPVMFVTDRADGVDDGSPITYRGVDCGHVSRVWLAEDRKSVYFSGEITANRKIPANVVGRIRSASVLGAGSIISLETEGEPTTETIKPNQQISAKFVGFGEMLPTEDFSALAKELTLTVRRFRETQIIEHIDEQVRHVGEVIASLNKIVSDPKTHEEIKATVANVLATTESAKTLAAKLDKAADELPQLTAQARETMGSVKAEVESVSRQLGERLTQIASLLDRFQSIAQKIDQGQGSAGALINDNRLYESLVDTSRELNAAVRDLKRLLEQWEQEGVSMRLR